MSKAASQMLAEGEGLLDVPNAAGYLSMYKGRPVHCIRDSKGLVKLGRWWGPLIEIGWVNSARVLVGSLPNCCILTMQNRLDRPNAAALHEALEVGEGKVLTEHLDQHNSVTVNVLVLDQLKEVT